MAQRRSGIPADGGHGRRARQTQERQPGDRLLHAELCFFLCRLLSSTHFVIDVGFIRIGGELSSRPQVGGRLIDQRGRRAPAPALLPR